MCVCVCVYIYIYICVCVCVCVYMYIYIYIVDPFIQPLDLIFHLSQTLCTSLEVVLFLEQGGG